MKRTVLILFAAMLSLTACSQDDKVFKEVATFEKGFNFVKNGPVQTNPFTGVGGVVDWNTIINKPNYDLLYKPIEYKPDWNEIQNKPQEENLVDVLATLAYTPLVQKTTIEITALVIPAGVVAMVWDKTLKVLKVWDGTKWKTIITNN